MSIKFTHVATLGAFICSALALVWAFQPQLLSAIFGLAQSPESNFIAKRTAALFAGFAVLLFGFRNTQRVDTIKVVSASFSTTCFFLACSGMFGYLNGTVGVGIFLAVATELSFIAAFLVVGYTQKAEKN